jgi:hypothetical protein
MFYAGLLMFFLGVVILLEAGCLDRRNISCKQAYSTSKQLFKYAMTENGNISLEHAFFMLVFICTQKHLLYRACDLWSMLI